MGKNYLGVPLRHASEQYFTSFHTFSHFFRHVIGRKHTTQIFSGKLDLLIRFFVISGPVERAKPDQQSRFCR